MFIIIVVVVQVNAAVVEIITERVRKQNAWKCPLDSWLGKQ
jgi:hypothetical protein